MVQLHLLIEKSAYELLRPCIYIPFEVSVSNIRNTEDSLININRLIKSEQLVGGR